MTAARTGGGRTEDGHGRLGGKLSGLAVAVGCALFLGSFGWGALVYRPYLVPTDSMTPSVRAGDRVLAERIDGADVRRGDIVVFRLAAWGDTPMVKRVVATGGDTVACCGRDGRLTVNGTPVAEPYLRTAGPASPTEFSTTVPEGHLFLLGDERNNSLDSRKHLQDAVGGSVPRSAVEARLDAVVWPLDGAFLERPEGFADLPGGISRMGPVKTILWGMAAGALLVFGGALHDPVRRALRRRGERRERRTEAATDAG
ncbi:signal peptidase I [Streptomyces sp. NPDC006798]|uniref:signal peptidase I n=1 Tax=Streptomyces sp. NPDC006798 TaxID=3155462 RepID=UPI0033D438C6